jgi:hypothetical protein
MGGFVVTIRIRFTLYIICIASTVIVIKPKGSHMASDPPVETSPHVLVEDHGLKQAQQIVQV